MTDLSGSASDPRRPWGVLGTATPAAFSTPAGSKPVLAVGIEGVVADSADSIAVYEAEIGDGLQDLPATAAVHGAHLATGHILGTVVVQANGFGFLGGRSPFAGEVTGVFGQATERGVIGIATTPGGVGVFGGSVGGQASGVIGDAVDNVGVTGRSTGASGVVSTRNSRGGCGSSRGLRGRHAGAWCVICGC